MNYVSVNNCCVTNFPRTQWLKTIIIDYFHNSTCKLGGFGDLVTPEKAGQGEGGEHISLPQQRHPVWVPDGHLALQMEGVAQGNHKQAG